MRSNFLGTRPPRCTEYNQDARDPCRYYWVSRARWRDGGKTCSSKRPKQGPTERETPCVAHKVSSTRELPGDRMTAVLRLRSGEGTMAVEWAGQF